METQVIAWSASAGEEAEEIIRLGRGDETAFTRLYQRHHQKIYANILKIVHRPEYAQEILQDVFLSLWQNRYKIDARKPVASWLFVVSYNKSMDLLKKKLREHIDFVEEYESLCTDVTEAEEQEELVDEQLRILEEAVELLSPRKREVFRLCRYEGYSIESVASMLNLSANSVSEYLKQANKSIRRYAAESYPHVYESSLGLIIVAHLFL